MPTALTLAELADATDEIDLGTSPWITVDQAMIDTFADATRDHQWIHVDAEKAADGPFGQTIAHGFLTASLLPEMLSELLEIPDSGMGVNYGMDRLRLTAPVPSGSRIRAAGKVVGTERKGDGVLIRAEMTVEIEGSDKPALVGTFLALRY
ncbi:MaoC family dehydratase [Euzebya sp.]|uniref:MaoC family dehydratase n=1 Tax=Euzebya sp. TaxID=1971409 RepID=UPI00351375AA